MFIKNLHDTCLYAIFQRQIDLKRSQRDQDDLGHPQRPCQGQGQPWGIQQVPVMFTKN